MSKTIEEYVAMGVSKEYQMEQIREGLESENNDSAEENDEESIPRFPFTRKAEEKEVP